MATTARVDWDSYGRLSRTMPSLLYGHLTHEDYKNLIDQLDQANRPVLVWSRASLVVFGLLVVATIGLFVHVGNTFTSMDSCFDCYHPEIPILSMMAGWVVIIATFYVGKWYIRKQSLNKIYDICQNESQRFSTVSVHCQEEQVEYRYWHNYRDDRDDRDDRYGRDRYATGEWRTSYTKKYYIEFQLKPRSSVGSEQAPPRSTSRPATATTNNSPDHAAASGSQPDPPPAATNRKAAMEKPYDHTKDYRLKIKAALAARPPAFSTARNNNNSPDHAASSGSRPEPATAKPPPPAATNRKAAMEKQNDHTKDSRSDIRAALAARPPAFAPGHTSGKEQQNTPPPPPPATVPQKVPEPSAPIQLSTAIPKATAPLPNDDDNDVEAAIPIVVVGQPVEVEATPRMTVQERLERLNRVQHLLKPDEYERKREEILDSL